MFRVGQKVVCVDAANYALAGMPPLIEGRIYIVRGFDRFVRRGVRAVYVEGVFGRKRRGGRGDGDELAFQASRFRPVVSRKTDISVLTAMLNPAPQHAPAQRGEVSA